MVLLRLGICSGDDADNDNDSINRDGVGLFSGGGGDSNGDCWDSLDAGEEGSTVDGTGDRGDDGGLRSLTTGFTVLRVRSVEVLVACDLNSLIGVISSA